MKPTYIVYAKRTPIGRIGGKLAPVRPDDLMSYLLEDYKNQLSFDPLLIETLSLHKIFQHVMMYM